jgi:hypothetical protein
MPTNTAKSGRRLVTGNVEHANQSLQRVGNDVIDLERKPAGVFFMEMAIFAATSRPLADEGLKLSIHHSPGRAARSWRALDFRMATKVSK